jgi:predicted nucleic acid-binding protein
VTVTADTSVVVPGTARWHDDHARADAALATVSRLPAHVLVESVSVLTRLPGGRALPVDAAVRLVRARCPGTPLLLDGVTVVELLERCAALGIGGGRMYDALVAETARHADHALLSLDQRAAPTYAALGVRLAALP